MLTADYFLYVTHMIPIPLIYLVNGSAIIRIFIETNPIRFMTVKVRLNTNFYYTTIETYKSSILLTISGLMKNPQCEPGE